MCLQLLAPMNFNLTSHDIQEAPDVRQRSIGTLPTNRHGLEKHAPSTASGVRDFFGECSTQKPAWVTGSVIGK